jgi:hypothetical protein
MVIRIARIGARPDPPEPIKAKQRGIRPPAGVILRRPSHSPDPESTGSDGGLWALAVTRTSGAGRSAMEGRELPFSFGVLLLGLVVAAVGMPVMVGARRARATD